jgi:hypothetical protein
MAESSMAQLAGGRARLLYAGRTPGVSLVAFGLFLEDRDLGLLFLFPEIMTEEKHRAQRQHCQQELEEAFHLNLPSLILFIRRKKSTGKDRRRSGAI